MAADASNLLLKGAFHWAVPQDTILITFWYGKRIQSIFIIVLEGWEGHLFFSEKNIELCIYQFRVNDRIARDYANMYIICVHNY